ncbi:MAG: OmpA family protein [Deltaproteobacteria bacterium]|nr:OmpA family protein [Deltaproteobacteria bacterium]
MSTRGRLTFKSRLLVRWWLGLVMTVLLASAPLLADQDKDLLDLESGALALSATTQFGGRWNAQSLLSGSNTTGWSSSRGHPYPNNFVIELPRPYLLKSFVIDNTGAEESSFRGISGRNFVLYGSTTSHEEGFDLILEGEAAQGDRKVFLLEEPTEVRWLKLEILSNWGNPHHTQLMELEAYGEPVGEVTQQRPIQGIYATNFGLMRLEQSAHVVIGCYDADNGTLSGRTNGRVLKFRWWENGPTAGIAFLVLSSDGNSLNGLWYQRGQVKGLWYGRRVNDERRPRCQVPVLDALVTSIYDSGLSVPKEKTSSDQVQEKTVSEKPLETESGTTIFRNIYFDIDSAEIKPQFKARLQEIVAAIQEQPSQMLIIEGHTDSTYTREHNLELSLRRAQAVAGWLIENGVDGSRLKTKGYGEFRPIADNNTEEGRALNRRVEITLQ